DDCLKLIHSREKRSFPRDLRKAVRAANFFQSPVLTPERPLSITRINEGGGAAGDGALRFN
ncbi:hypothetical protein J8J40_20265, partial [Mycobacterium tuberculosis]|nr:hypothetical protein [Mycobacterium tuberculosis]